MTVNSVGSIARNYEVSGSEESALLKKVTFLMQDGAARLDSLSSCFAGVTGENERQQLLKDYTQEYYRIKRGQMFVFTVSGFMAALAGLLFASRSGSGQPIIGDQYAMQAIAGTVIGGTAMTGGKANIAMTFIGVMMVVCLQNGLIMAGVPAFYQHIATGAAVVLAIWVQTERKK